jgi:hypothetical protein
MNTIAENYKFIEKVMLFTHMYSLSTRNKVTSEALSYFCQIVPQVCSTIQENIKLSDEIDNLSRESDEAAHYLNGGGYRNLIHYAQCFNSKTF